MIQQLIRDTVTVVLGPLNFWNGVPEYGPYQPNVRAIVLATLGTMIWAAIGWFLFRTFVF